MEDPGSFFFLTYLNEEMDTLWLVSTGNYGLTYNPLNNRIYNIAYHPNYEVLGCNINGESGLYVSYDHGNTVTQRSESGNNIKYNWISSDSSLVAISNYFEYSYDTLQTWDYIIPRHPPYGNVTGTTEKRIQGWSAGDQMIMTHIVSPNGVDSLCVNFSTTYGDSFFVIESIPTSEMYWTGYLCKGYAPGECYYIDWEYGLVHTSSDTGRTWDSAGQIPVQPNIYSVVKFEFGWAPGELLVYHCWYDFWSEVGDVEIWFSDDFCATWEQVYSLDVEDASLGESLPSRPEFQTWPNPTNGQITIQLTTPASMDVSLYSLTGRLINSWTSSRQHTKTLNLEQLGSGAYFLRVQSAWGVQTKKILLVR